ncbi:hypothetical protein GCM10023149_37300 [Mucilaginibacter gynuensis]|uniref:Uncharacterized protein n=2 Tax=Mucilaginibacter gynuensis TaxID=1302236 RepID=A0ABP8GYQ6_9SPHI
MTDDDYKHEIANRIKYIMVISGLEIIGLSKFTGISDSHIYSILNKRRILTNKVANRIGEKFNFDGKLIFNLNIEIPNSIAKSATLKKFLEDNKLNYYYFLSNRAERKGRLFIENILLGSDFFENPKFTWEVSEECVKYGRHFSSNEINGHLKYLVVKKLLKSKKAKIKLRNGKEGARMVDVFWKPNLHISIMVDESS